METFRLCRICISESAVMMSIFGEDALWKKVMSFANVQIEECDFLPQQICMGCAKNVLNACAFKQKCENADQFYRSHLKKANISSGNKKTSVASSSKSCSIFYQNTGESTDVISRKNEKVSSGRPSENDYPVIVAGSERFAENPWSTGARYDDAEEDPDYQLPLCPEVEIHAAIDEDHPDATIAENDLENKMIKHPKGGYQCGICWEYFAKKMIVSRHIRKEHAELLATYKCFECKKQFQSQRYLERHVQLGSCINRLRIHDEANLTDNAQTVAVNYSSQAVSSSGAASQNGYQAGKQENQHGENLPFRLGVPFSYPNAIVPFAKKRAKKRKPINHNRKTRVRLTAKIVAQAKEMFSNNENNGKIAAALGISRTFVWRLRKTFTDCTKEKPLAAVQQIKSLDIDQKLNVISEKCGAQQSNENNSNQIVGDEKVETNSDLCLQTHQSIPNQANTDRGNFQTHSEQTETTPSGSQSIRKIEGTEETNNSFQSKSPESTNHDDESELENTTKVTKDQSKPRKQSVFVNEQMYEQAKLIVANEGGTNDLSRLLNISTMSAWKLRRCILRGIPIKFGKRGHRPLHKGLTRQLEATTTPSINPPDFSIRKKSKIREERNQRISQEILEILKADSGIQYRKVAEILTEKGFPMSSSSVCLKLKKMGLQRRWKTGTVQDELADDKVSDNELTTPTTAKITATATTTTTTGNDGDGHTLKMTEASF